MVWRKKDELITVQDIALPYERLAYIHLQDLLKLPPPYDSGDEPELQEPNPEWSEKYVTELDGYIAIDEPWKPQNEEEEKELVERFLSGLRKLLDREANWTFLQPLMLSLEYCAR